MCYPYLKCAYFYLHYLGVGGMDGGLEGINQDKSSYKTSMNACKAPNLLVESWKIDAESSVSRDHYGSEYNNYGSTYAEEFDD